jgi:hypothetical protein
LGTFELRGKIAHVTIDLDQFGVGIKLDIFMLLDFVDQTLEGFAHFVALQGVMGVPQVASQLALPFHQGGGKTLLGQVQGGGHAGNSPPDDQGFIDHRHRLLGKRLDVASLGNSHPDQVLGLGGGRLNGSLAWTQEH